MAKSCKLRASSIDEPRLVFTPAVTEADLARLHHKPTEFGSGAVKTIMYIEEESQNKLMRRAEATLAPDPNERWNYHQTLEIYRGNKWAISEFPKWRKYLILLSFLDNSSARPVQIGGVDVNICHSRVDRSPRTPAVQFAIPPRGDHFVAHGRALWKLTGRGRTERAHRAVENAVRFPRASTGPFPSSHPRKTPKGP